MRIPIKYKFNKETLDYDQVKEPSLLARTLIKVAVYAVSSLAIFFLVVYFFTGITNFKDPKTAIIERNLKEWSSKLEIVNARYDALSMKLSEMENRDNNIYRSIFGMEPLNDDIREAGFGGVERYDYLKTADMSGHLTYVVRKSDILIKKAYVQSNSFDKVFDVAQRVGEMATCVPSIPPVDFTNTYKSSNFGMRLDPINKKYIRHHNGVDLAPRSHKDGEPVYVTGNGKVTEVEHHTRGFGNYIEIDHGFGYKTRYAHLSKILVTPGQEVKLGQQIAEMGNTGHSSGTHLHYEVIYMNKPVNPVNYYSADIKPEDYAAIIHKAEENPS